MMVVSVVVFFINGFLLMSLFKRSSLSFFERLGLGFWVYSGLFTFLFFFLHLYARVAYTFINGWLIHLLLGGIFCLIFILKERKNYSGFTLRKEKIFFWKNWHWWEYGVFFLLLFTWLIPFFHGLLFPIPGWDSLVLYDFYGYVFAKEGDMFSTLRYGYFDAYPFYIHLSHMWLYLTGFPTPLFWHAFLYITLVWVSMGWAGRYFSQRYAVWVVAVLTSGMASLYGHSTLGYNNLDAVGFLSLAFLYGFEWVRTKEYPYLLLSSLLGGGYLWCRNGEPWWVGLLVFYLVSLVLVKVVKWWKKGVLFVLSFVFLLTTKVVWEYSLRNWENLLMFSKKHSLVVKRENDENQQNSKEKVSLQMISKETIRIIGSLTRPFRYLSWERLKKYVPLAMDMFWRAIVKTRLVYWWVIVFLMILFFSERGLWTKPELWFFPFFFWINAGMIFVGTYVFIQSFPDWNIPGSAERMSMFLEPLVVFWTVVLVGEYRRKIPEEE
ncbi:MAG: hypothetical protein ACK4TN_04310 [Brevinematales bacterium]